MTSLCDDRGGNLLVTQGEKMASEWASAFYTSTMWKKTRASYISYRRGLCERCRERGIVRAGVEVHHIQPLTQDNINDANVTLNWNNLMLLCPTCHDEIHKRTEKKTRHKRFIVNADGTITTRKSKE